MAAFSLGGVVGPIAATYATLSESTVYAIAAGCSLLSVILTACFLGESLSDELQWSKRRQIIAKRHADHPDLLRGLTATQSQLQVQPLDQPLLVVTSASLVEDISIGAPPTPPHFRFAWVCSNPLSDTDRHACSM
jgi:hypothetical protein